MELHTIKVLEQLRSKLETSSEDQGKIISRSISNVICFSSLYTSSVNIRWLEKERKRYIQKYGGFTHFWVILNDWLFCRF